MSTVLIIEDSEGQRAEIRAALEHSLDITRVLEATDGIRGLKLLLAESPDLVLCDLEMPGLDGEKLLSVNKEAGEDRAVPFLVLTAVGDAARRARLLQKGASDVIIKPFHTADLMARLELHLKLLQTQRELIEKNDALRRLSRTDPLTSLPNRRHMDEVLEREFARARRYGTPFAVAIADVDHFKKVNDEHGHLLGDEVLVRVAEQTAEIVRETDCGGRFGGEEFLAILGNNDRSGAEIFAERWRERVSGICVQADKGRSIRPTISIGIAEWEPGISSGEALLARADASLYRAKRLGRDRVCAYSDADDGPVAEVQD